MGSDQRGSSRRREERGGGEREEGREREKGGICLRMRTIVCIWMYLKGLVL